MGRGEDVGSFGVFGVFGGASGCVNGGVFGDFGGGAGVRGRCTNKGSESRRKGLGCARGGMDEGAYECREGGGGGDGGGDGGSTTRSGCVVYECAPERDTRGLLRFTPAPPDL